MQVCSIFWLQKLFRDTVYRLQSTGVLNKLRDDVTQTKREVPLPRYRINQPLNLTQLAGLMAIIVIGLLLSAMVFFCEMSRGGQMPGQNPVIRLNDC